MLGTANNMLFHQIGLSNTNISKHYVGREWFWGQTCVDWGPATHLPLSVLSINLDHTAVAY